MFIYLICNLKKKGSNMKYCIRPIIANSPIKFKQFGNNLVNRLKQRIPTMI